MTPHPKTTTDDSALRDLPAALDLAVFEQLPTAFSSPIGQLPAWLPISDSFPLDLAEEFPMLELFFPDFIPVGIRRSGEDLRHMDGDRSRRQRPLP